MYKINDKIYNKKIKLNSKLYDKNAMHLLELLNGSGYEAYLVGGCVRDLLLYKKPNDWDIATSAKPEEVCKLLLKNNINIFNNGGISYGTVSAIINSDIYEITTFRKDVYGSDSHIPEKIIFSKNLEDDLSRRDFTINAIASDIYGNIYDYFNGQKDLKNGELKAIGDAEKRFCEDSLRLFRACRFLGQLNFKASYEMVEAMPYAFFRVSGLSLDRVKKEINKLILSDYPSLGFELMVKTHLNETFCRVKENRKYEQIAILPELTHLVNLPQMKEFHKYDVWKHSLVTMDASLPFLINRWAALLHDVGKGVSGVRVVNGTKITDYNHDIKGSEMVESLFNRWRMPEYFIKRVAWIVANHMKFHFFVNYSEPNKEKWIRKLAKSKMFKTQNELNEAFLQLLDVCKSDVVGCGKPIKNTENHVKFYEEIKKIIFTVPISKKELKLNSNIVNILKPFVGKGLENLLERVQNGTLNNNSDDLYRAAKRYRRRQISEDT